MQTIGQLCERTVHISSELKGLESDIFEYCNKLANEILNDKDFEFHELPPEIYNVLFNGGDTPSHSWTEFIETEIKKIIKD